VTEHRKLVILGGSSPNTPAFFEALSQTGGGGWDEVCLVGRSTQNVERVGQACASRAVRLGLTLSVTWETDVERAADGASIVLNMLRVGGAPAVGEDRRLLAASGIVGHASSYPEAIRHLPPTLAAARAVERVAPSAIFVNFANPVSILCEAIATETTLTCLGICHHAFSMRTDFARLLGVPADQLRVEYQGLNHLGWVTDVQVGGQSRFPMLIDRLVQGRVKAYDYPLAPAFNAIPIKHAASLYRRGEVLYVRQYGARSSLVDVALRYGVGGPLERLSAMREGPRESRPPWYASCIVPFLNALNAGEAQEFIVTWRHAGSMPEVPGLTAETTATVSAAGVAPAPLRSHLPAAAREWLRQVRASERLLLAAVKDRSYAGLLEALAIHPSVVSVKHARQFVERLRRTTALFANV
jgi:6-phospho-beta-glucosidase